jgi:1-acyl-sn-glycerol-3-phosphate acyltransferase
VKYPPVGAIGPRVLAWWSLLTQTESVRVEGLEHVPATGPVLIVSRHVHHLLDGIVLIHYLPRTVHIVVGLDWTANATERRWMERACRWAGWPVILRPQSVAASGAYSPDEVAKYLRSGLRDAAALLRDGRVVVVFPEGYPLIEPARSHLSARAQDDGALLPFAAGFRSIVQLAERYGARDIAIVPVGLSYTRPDTKWRIVARFGAPMTGDAPLEEIERAVRDLSR